MNEKVSDFFAIVIPILLYIGLLVGLPVGISVYNNNKVSCSKETIPYSKTTTYDDTLYTYQSNTTTYGQNGTKEVCVKGSAKETVSSTVLTQPIAQVTSQGTKTYTYTPRYRIGAICGDGTRSYATGRGACSWHGGVSRWLYGE